MDQNPSSLNESCLDKNNKTGTNNKTAFLPVIESLVNGNTFRSFNRVFTRDSPHSPVITQNMLRPRDSPSWFHSFDKPSSHSDTVSLCCAFLISKFNHFLFPHPAAAEHGDRIREALASPIASRWSERVEWWGWGGIHKRRLWRWRRVRRGVGAGATTETQTFAHLCRLDAQTPNYKSQNLLQVII